MELIINKTPISDPLLKHLSDYVNVVQMDIIDDVITDLALLYSFLNHTKEEYLESNARHYRKPTGFQMVLNQPSCCPHSIKISYGSQFIIIKKK